MLNLIRRFVGNFKEYVLFVVLSVISLSILSANEKPQAKHLKTFAIASFAVLNQLANSFTLIFQPNPSVEELKAENARLMLELNKLRQYGLENEELRTMISFKDTSKFPLVPAKVISKLVAKTEGNFIINVGANEQIQKGMPVITSQGLVGIASEVSGNFTLVKTLTNSMLSIAVTIQRINVQGILNYDGTNLIIKNVPTTYDVQIGDRVETSDFSSLFPPSVPVGVIQKKESNVYGLLHNLVIKPFADIAAVNNVFVIKIVPSKEINNLEMNLMK